ncbi:MAG: hypothetical protein EOO73_02215 [Myxococcales bacterium]|nr:MAG: hypothetical protein EOO73_02215 [Myxococcales bacterium]
MSPRREADGCCRTCYPDAAVSTPAVAVGCAHADCAACPEKTRPQPVEGECCPRCVALDYTACASGQARYEQLRRESEAELLACKEDRDCIVVSFGDACRASCPTPVNREHLGTAAARLSEEAAALCGACPQAAFQCEYQPSTEASCVNERCTARSPVEGARVSSGR